MAVEYIIICVCVYNIEQIIDIHIYIYIHTCIYVYILYIDREIDRYIVSLSQVVRLASQG